MNKRERERVQRENCNSLCVCFAICLKVYCSMGLIIERWCSLNFVVISTNHSLSDQNNSEGYEETHHNNSKTQGKSWEWSCETWTLHTPTHIVTTSISWLLVGVVEAVKLCIKMITTLMRIKKSPFSLRCGHNAWAMGQTLGPQEVTISNFHSCCHFTDVIVCCTIS
jgi:hypothetical protein